MCVNEASLRAGAEVGALSLAAAVRGLIDPEDAAPVPAGCIRAAAGALGAAGTLAAAAAAVPVAGVIALVGACPQEPRLSFRLSPPAAAAANSGAGVRGGCAGADKFWINSGSEPADGNGAAAEGAGIGAGPAPAALGEIG